MKKILHEIIDVAEMLNDPRIVPGSDLDLLREKASKYDQLESLLQELVEDFRKDTALGSHELYLYEQIESIVTSEVRSPEETQ